MSALLSERGKLIVFLRATGLFICAITPFSEMLLTPNIVPSDDYIQSNRVYYFLVIFSFGIINLLSMSHSKFAARLPRKIAYHEYFASRIGFILLFSVCFQVFLQSSLPSLILRFSGTPTFVELEVKALNPNRDRKFCIRGIFLENKPYFADEICNISPKILSTLNAGDLIVVSGNGNWMGVIPERVTRAH